MSDRWHPTRDLLGLPGMPNVGRSITLHGPKRGWVSRPGSRGLEWLESSLPEITREALRSSPDAQRSTQDAAGVPPCAPAASSSRARAVSDRDRAIADARLDILYALDRWLSEHRPAVLDAALYRFAALFNAGEIQTLPETRNAGQSVSRTSLVKWRRRLRKGGWGGLLPKRGGHNRGQGGIDRDPEVRDAIVAQVLERPGHVNAKHIIRALRVSFAKDRVPAYRTLQRWVAEWRAANTRLISAVADPDRHRSHYLPAGGSAAAGIVRLNQLWELDSTPADVLCTDGRHSLVGTIDVATRRAMVLVVPTSAAAAIAALMRRAILAWGVPEAVRTDEGSDYTSRHIRRALANLGIRHDALPPFSPEKKPFIERFFRTLSAGLFERLPGFAGHNVAEAQALRSRKAFAQRRGEDDAAAFSVALSAAELQVACDAWLDTVYDRETHAGIGRSPFAAAAGQPVRAISDERVLDVLLAEPADGGGGRTVGKKGIACEGTTFIAPELGALVGERVEVRLDPADAGGIYVFDRAGGFICRAVAAERAGIDRKEIAVAMRRQAKEADTEARRYARQLKRQVKPETAIDAILAEGRAAAATVVAFPGASAEAAGGAIAEAAVAVAAGTSPPAEQPIDEEELEFLRRRNAELAREAAARRRAEEDEEEALRAEARAAVSEARTKGIG